jgi:hypothetical protein
MKIDFMPRLARLEARALVKQAVCSFLFAIDGDKDIRARVTAGDFGRTGRGIVRPGGKTDAGQTLVSDLVTVGGGGVDSRTFD